MIESKRASALDSGFLVDGEPVRKRDLRRALDTARTEIEHGGFFRLAVADVAPRSVANRLAETVSLLDFPPALDGRMGRALATALAATPTLNVPAGAYDLSDLAEPIPIARPTTVLLDERAVLRGAGEATPALFDLRAGGGLTLKGGAVTDLGELICGDGGNASVDFKDIHLEELTLERVGTALRLFRCERASLASLYVRRLRFRDGAMGLSAPAGSIGPVTFTECTFSNLHLHPHHRRRPGTFAYAIAVGANMTAPRGPVRITFNDVDGVHNHAGTSPCNAVRVIAHDVLIFGNVIRNLSTAHPERDDCEGIYTKAVRCHISHNQLRDAGRNEAAIAVKGVHLDERSDTPRGFLNAITHNIVEFGDPSVDHRGGILLQSSHTDCSFNTLQYAGKTHGSRSQRGVITTTKQRRLDGLRITHNKIYGVGCCGLHFRHHGTGLYIADNLIELARPQIAPVDGALWSVLFEYRGGPAMLRKVRLERNCLSFRDAEDLQRNGIGFRVEYGEGPFRFNDVFFRDNDFAAMDRVYYAQGGGKIALEAPLFQNNVYPSDASPYEYVYAPVTDARVNERGMFSVGSSVFRIASDRTPERQLQLFP